MDTALVLFKVSYECPIITINVSSEQLDFSHDFNCNMWSPREKRNLIMLSIQNTLGAYTELKNHRMVPQYVNWVEDVVDGICATKQDGDHGVCKTLKLAV